MILPNELIQLIIGYLPFIYFKTVNLWNRHYRNYYQTKHLTYFSFLKQNIHYNNYIIYKSLSLQPHNQIITINIIDLARVIYRLNTFYTIFFENNEKIHLPMANQFLSTYIYDLSIYLNKLRGFSIEFADNKKRPLSSYSLHKLPYLEKKNIINIQYLVINNHPYHIKGWTRHLAEYLKDIPIYYKFKKIIQWLIILLKEHLGKLIFLDDIDMYRNIKLIENKKPVFSIPQYIYCSGCTKNKKPCRNRIYYSRFYREGLSKWYCYLHQPSKKKIIYPSSFNYNIKLRPCL